MRLAHTLLGLDSPIAHRSVASQPHRPVGERGWDFEEYTIFAKTHSIAIKTCISFVYAIA